MKSSRCLPILAVSGLAAVLFAPANSSRADADADAKAANALVQEVIAQQKILAENQAKIDEKLAAIAEQLRVARIFESRAGGPHK